MPNTPEVTNMAVFCDFENIALGVQDAKYEQFDIGKVLERLLLKGSIVVKKAYCDWERYKAFKAPMHEASFELIEIPHVRQSGKNSADIRMVVDALDLCYTKAHVETFVIISGDSDFSPLVSKLRENNKDVIGVGVKNSTSDLLIANCDEFIFYDDLVREKKRPAGEESRGTTVERAPTRVRAAKKGDEERRQEAVDLITATVDALFAERGAEEKIWGSMVKQALKRRKPGFAESYYGFRSFNGLLEEAERRGVLALERDEKSGGYMHPPARARRMTRRWLACVRLARHRRRDGRCRTGVDGRDAAVAQRSIQRPGCWLCRAATTVNIPADVAYKRSMSFRAVPIAALLDGTGADGQRSIHRRGWLRGDASGHSTARARGDDGLSRGRTRRRAMATAEGGRSGKRRTVLPRLGIPGKGRAGTEQWPYRIVRIDVVGSLAKRFPMIAPAAKLPASQRSDPPRLCGVPEGLHGLPHLERWRRRDARSGPQYSRTTRPSTCARRRCGDSFAIRRRSAAGLAPKCPASTGSAARSRVGGAACVSAAYGGSEGRAAGSQVSPSARQWPIPVTGTMTAKVAVLGALQRPVR